MTPLRDRILIESLLDQKQAFYFADGMKFHLVPNRHLYEQNSRETMPVVAKVLQAGAGVPESIIGQYVVLHHNTVFDPEFHIQAHEGISQSVIPYDKWVMGWIDEKGDLQPLNGNIICERIPEHIDSVFEVPEAARKTCVNLMKVLRSSSPEAKEGHAIIVYKHSDYEVVYMWGTEEKRAIVVKGGDMLGWYDKNCFGKRIESKRVFEDGENVFVFNHEAINNQINRINSMKPLKDRVIIKPDESPEKIGEFILPSAAQPKPLRGVVVAVGPGSTAKDTGVFIPTELKAGEVVFFGKNAGTEVEIEGEKYRVMFEAECLLTL